MSKEWAWSYSKKKNYDNCPKKHQELDLLRNYNETTEALTWGNEVHAALANACIGKSPLPESMASYQKWVDQIKDPPSGTLLVEQKFAITRNFQKTSWFAPNAWYRGICDVALVDGPVAVAWDWKTGKVQHDSVQLMLMAQMLFIHYPEVRKIRTEFIWLADGTQTKDWWDRDTIGEEWVELLPQIKAMEQASKTNNFPPKPSGLCVKWCPVKTCEFHGKGTRG